MIYALAEVALASLFLVSRFTCCFLEAISFFMRIKLFSWEYLECSFGKDGVTCHVELCMRWKKGILFIIKIKYVAIKNHQSSQVDMYY